MCEPVHRKRKSQFVQDSEAEEDEDNEDIKPKTKKRKKGIRFSN